MKRLLLLPLVLVGLIGAAFAQTHPTTLGTTNASVTIATGNTFQSILSSVQVNTQARQSITIQNNNTNNDNCWLYIGATASATKGTSILLAPGGSYQRYYPYIPTDNIAATCTTTNDTLYL